METLAAMSNEMVIMGFYWSCMKEKCIGLHPKIIQSSTRLDHFRQDCHDSWGSVEKARPIKRHPNNHPILSDVVPLSAHSRLFFLSLFFTYLYTYTPSFSLPWILLVAIFLTPFLVLLLLAPPTFSLTERVTY